MFATGRFKLLPRLAAVAVLMAMPLCASALAQTSKPNILFIMGDDIGWMQPSIYHEGLAVGETLANIDRIGHEGAKFLTYYAEQSWAGLGVLLSLPVCSRCASAWFCRKSPEAHLTCGPVHPHSPSSCSISATPPASSARTISEITQSRSPHGTRVPGILGLSLSPRCHAAGELSRHQQVPHGAGHRTTLQKHADPGPV